ncbi:hypothetical protein BU23DRAFT_40741 [Bimuria novae-zelandiae CBS 107.79]|uniref:HNH nuclease domain-containing protein n=1 Tax=Bimuria novae-zelandiae CBS 107.79 TaxID=1447943 RepID=A0A6A5UJF0_9PLEO|nr:hypothetical protein BU23DRAFT_40741 [Bimuria novae-zelandiae CBS 107.79]
MMFEAKTVPVWTVFCIQILLDIEECLGETISNGFNDLHRHVQRGLAKWSQIEVEAKSTSNKAMIRTHLLQKKFMNDFTKWVLEDYIVAQIRRTAPAKGKKQIPLIKHEVFKRQPIQKGFFLDRHPLRCGLIKYEFSWFLNSAGLAVDNQTRHIHLLPHIYVAARILDPNARSWPDMELAVYRQDPARLFFGGRQDSLAQAKSKFDLALGGSVVNAASNKGSGGKKKKRIPRMRALSKCIASLPSCFLQGKVDMILNSESPDPFVPRLIQFLSEKKNHLQVSRQLNRSDNEAEEYFQKYSTNTGKVPTIDKVLNALTIWFIADQMDLLFNWNELQLTCTATWQDLLKSVGNGKQTAAGLASAALEEAKNNELEG